MKMSKRIKNTSLLDYFSPQAKKRKENAFEDSSASTSLKANSTNNCQRTTLRKRTRKKMPMFFALLLHQPQEQPILTKALTLTMNLRGMATTKLIETKV